jgi:putative protease
MQIYMQISGHVLMMESRWHLISNFVKTQSTINLDLTNKKLFLKEPTRKVPTIIYEDAHGTYVFTNYDLCLIDAIDELQTNHVDVVIIDSFLHDDIWINQMTKLFMSKINHQIVNFDQQVLTNPISKGFYEGTKNNLVYLLTEGVYE